MQYTDSHMWIRMENEVGTVGISRYGREELGDIVHIELPRIGQDVVIGEEVAVLESTKAAVDIYSPVSGRIVAINDILREKPNVLNDFPETTGWLFAIALSHPDELNSFYDLADYQTFIHC